VASQRERQLIEQFAKTNGIPVLGFVPYDKKILETDRQGDSPLKHANQSAGVRAIRELGEKLLETNKAS